MTKQALTSKQQVMYEFIQQYITEHQRSPIIREIQDGCQISSYKSAVDRLNALERKRYIKRIPNKHRGIRLVRRPPVTEVEPPLAPVEAA